MRPWLKEPASRWLASCCSSDARSRDRPRALPEIPLAGAPQGVPPRAAPSAPAGNACNRKLITAADVAPLLSEPVSSEKPLAGDAQSCVFETAGFSYVTGR